MAGIMPHYSLEDTVQNMKDAGFSPEAINSCISCIQKGSKEELMKKLDIQRSSLLDKVHEGERQIDCLDYLVYRLGGNE